MNCIRYVAVVIVYVLWLEYSVASSTGAQAQAVIFSPGSVSRSWQSRDRSVSDDGQLLPVSRDSKNEDKI